MVRPLQTLLEKEFELCYYVPGFTLDALDNTDVRILDWFQGRLYKQFKEEERELKKRKFDG